MSAHRDVNTNEQCKLNFAWLELTNRCNLSCQHCYAASGPHEPAGHMRYDDWCHVMDELRDVQCDQVQFIGGEPTLYPRFVDLIAAARQKGFSFVEVYTNATRLSPALCRELKRYNVDVAVSFYSKDEHIHDSITRHKGSFKRTVKGISEAAQHGLNVRAGVVTMNENSACVDETINFVSRLGVSSVRVDRQRHIGRASIGTEQRDLIPQLCGGCGKGRIAINADGDVSPCVFSHFWHLGNVSEGISNVVQKPDLDQFLNQLTRATSTNMACTPKCSPHECSPARDPGPCFPKRCDPDICSPRNCAPID